MIEQKQQPILLRKQRANINSKYTVCPETPITGFVEERTTRT